MLGMDIPGTPGKHCIFARFLEFSRGMLYRDSVTRKYVGIDDSLLESAARCLNAQSVRALGALQLGEAAQSLLQSLAEKANDGQLTSEAAHEYDRFIELDDIIAILRLKAERK